MNENEKLAEALRPMKELQESQTQGTIEEDKDDEED